MTDTPSVREQVLAGVFALLGAGLPAVNVQRNRDKPARPSPGGDVIVYDGEPGEPDWDFSPAIANYDHLIPLDVQSWPSESPEADLDSLLRQIGRVIASNRTLDGLAERLELVAPDASWSEAQGAQSIRCCSCGILASYRTADPL